MEFETNEERIDRIHHKQFQRFKTGIEACTTNLARWTATRGASSAIIERKMADRNIAADEDDIYTPAHLEYVAADGTNDYFDLIITSGFADLKYYFKTASLVHYLNHEQWFNLLMAKRPFQLDLRRHAESEMVVAGVTYVIDFAGDWVGNIAFCCPRMIQFHADLSSNQIHDFWTEAGPQPRAPYRNP